MSDTVNAEVMETREPVGFPELWTVQWLNENWRFDLMVMGNEAAARRWMSGAMRMLRARLIRIPAEGEEPPTKQPATRDEIATAYELGSKSCTWLVYYQVWREAERYHGITEITK